MSKKTAAAGLVQARVLSDLPSLGLTNGQVVADTPENIEAMTKAMHADDHPDAVAYALSVGAEVVDLPALRTASDAQA